MISHLSLFFATSTSGRFVKLKFNAIISKHTSVPNLIKQLFHSRLLDMRLVIANSALWASLAIYHLISNARSWNNRPYSYSLYWTGTSLQLRLMRGVFSNANHISLFLMIFPRMSLHSKLVPVQYREYEYGLLLIIISLR